MEAVFSCSSALSGEVEVPADKSVSHRAAIVASLADGESTIRNFSPAADCTSTLTCLRSLGVRALLRGSELEVEGRCVGSGLKEPGAPLDAGNSGTTMRLLAGAVATQEITVEITGDPSLRSRPMGRIIDPLRMMGARVAANDEFGHPPLTVRGGGLKGIEYEPRVASAQVKSCVLLAGLGAQGPTTVREVSQTRDHTERLLARAGLEVSRFGLSVAIFPGTPRGFEMDVPGDVSSAAFLLAAAIMLPGSEVTVRSVGLNPTRTGFLRVLERMGADIEIEMTEDHRAPVGSVPEGEPLGDITARHSELSSVKLATEEVADTIDEVTLVALLATRAQGVTVIKGAEELRHKESDRIESTVAGLRALGAIIEELPDGISVEGPCMLRGAVVDPRGDHRIAMMLAVAGLVASGSTVISGWECAAISYPGFDEAIVALGGQVS